MDRIDLLEAKVKQMIEVVQALRQENQALQDRLAASDARYRALAEERTVLDRERDVVRDRIEQLLGDLAGMEEPSGNGTEPARGDEGPRRAAERPGPDLAENPVLPGMA